MTPKTILVTGSAGFIGGNFVKNFRERFPKAEVIGLDMAESKNGESRFYKGSICDDKILEEIFSVHKPEYVFHFAAIPRVSYSVLHPAETTLVNVYGTSLLLEKARDHKVKRFIFSSSSSVYGGAKKLPTKEQENPPRPVSPYAAHKYSGELLCRLASELYGLDTVCLRYFNVYGPGQYGSAPYSTVASAWLEALYFGKGEKPFLEGNGKQSRDFSYVGDVVEANILAMLHKQNLGGAVFNIGSGKKTDVLTVKKLIEKHSGKKLDLEKRESRPGDVRHTLADISKARRILGFRPKTSFEDGLIKMIRWFESRTE